MYDDYLTCKEDYQMRKEAKERINEKSVTRVYELVPSHRQKSFYGKALIACDNHGNKTLYSYFTPIITIYNDGSKIRHWDDWSATTGKHIAEFANVGKAEYFDLPLGPVEVEL